MKKWNTKLHKYESYEIPKEWHTPILDEMNEPCNCAECGAVHTYGDMFSSLLIHTDSGFGYPVCDKCYEKEVEERLKERNG